MDQRHAVDEDLPAVGNGGLAAQTGAMPTRSWWVEARATAATLIEPAQPRSSIARSV